MAGDRRGAYIGDEEAALERVQLVSDLLDEAFEVPGTDFKVGLDPILGVVPVGGDAAAAAVSLYPVLEAINLRAPNDLVLKMLLVVGVDAVVGSVPVLGTVFDAVWKANKWNAAMLEEYVQTAAAE